jgi:malonyl-CoA/methylmalonyl-CoA synthetase
MSANLFEQFAGAWGSARNRPALVEPNGGTLTFADLDCLSARFVTALRARGVVPGDRVVVQVEKSVGAVALYLACLRAGAIFVPLNTAYTGSEIGYFLADAEPKLFIASSDMAGPDADLWAEALRSDPFETVASCAADDLAAILYTSGTTGRSKGAMITHGNLASNAQTLHRLWGFQPDDVLIHALPIFHVHGLFVALHTIFLNASTTLFLSRFDAAQIIELMPRATLLMGVPTFYTRLVNESGLESAVRNMRLFISGSAPLLAETHRSFAERTGHLILERYGMTETGMIASNPLDGERVAGTVGYPLPEVEVRVADEAGTPVAVDTPGVIEVRGPNVFKGYWRNSEKTAEDIRPDGWFITGDVATQAKDGRLTIVGRAKDLIISGGYNIYPKEIEEVIDAVPGVVESAVIGIPDPDFGEAVLAVIVGDQALEAPVLAAVQTRLARFKHPRRLEFVNDLPRNAMGKVQKAELRAKYR